MESLGDKISLIVIVGIDLFNYLWQHLFATIIYVVATPRIVS